jgi:hypothetical protein
LLADPVRALPLSRPLGSAWPVTEEDPCLMVDLGNIPAN